MTTDGPRARHLARPLAAAVAALASLSLLAACSSSSGAADPGGPGSPTGSGASGGPTASAPGTAVPSQDVVSSIAADPKLKAELPSSVQSKGSLILGTTINPGTVGLPHAGVVNGKNVGLDVDLRNAVANVLGIKWDVQNGTFATIIPGVQNGKYDVGQDNFGATKAREQVVDFATYLNDGQAFLASKNVEIDKATSLTDLCGLTIATSPGSTFQQLLTDSAGKCGAAGKKAYKVQYFADAGPIFLGLANGKVDVYFGPTLSLEYDATHIANTKFLGQISSTPVGFVTKKGSPVAKALSAAVNELIANGDYAKIFAKWGLDASGITKSTLNPATTF